MAKTTGLYWVRHGPTNCHTLYGWKDISVDLTDHCTIQWVSTNVPHNAIVLSSDLIRASQTADAVAGSRERLPNAKQLREFNFGDWEGKSYEEIYQNDRCLAEEFWNNPGFSSPPNGESWFQLQSRVNPFIDDLVSTYPDRDFILVAHFGVILNQLQQATKTPYSEIIKQPIKNFSITKINYYQGERSVEYANKLPE